VFDPVTEPPREEFDLLPEAVRVMRRMGVLMRPELRAIWEPAVTGALAVLTREERADSIRFLERALGLVADASAPATSATAEHDPDHERAAARKQG
jgi:hypothetical protein